LVGIGSTFACGHHPTLDCSATLAELIDEFVSADVDKSQPTRRGAATD
jgi:hypothetical protein